MLKSKKCVACNINITDINTIGLNKKILGGDRGSYLCVVCLAEFLDVTQEELLDKIEEFKEQGCDLFV